MISTDSFLVFSAKQFGITAAADIMVVEQNPPLYLPRTASWAK
jgi:hypothetical protein